MIRWTNNLCEYRLSLGACRSSLLHPYRSMYLKSKVTPATRDERTQIFQSRTIKSRTLFGQSEPVKLICNSRGVKSMFTHFPCNDFITSRRIIKSKFRKRAKVLHILAKK